MRKFTYLATVAAVLAMPGTAMAEMGQSQTSMGDVGANSQIRDERVDTMGQPESGDMNQQRLGYPQQPGFEQETQAGIDEMDMDTQRQASTIEEESRAQADETGAGQQSANLEPQTVRELQQALNEQGYNPGSIDGIMGPNTRSAIEDFQRSAGLEVTGRPNPNTLERLGVNTASAAGMTGDNMMGQGQAMEQGPSGQPPSAEGQIPEQRIDSMEQQPESDMGSDDPLLGAD